MRLRGSNSVACQDDEQLLHVCEDAFHVEDLHNTCDISDRLGASLESVSRLTYSRSIPAFDDGLEAACCHNTENTVAVFLPS